MRDLEANLQYEYMDKAKEYVAKKSAELGRPLTFCVVTFGCQMNARDSEKLVGILEKIGYQETEDEHADFVIYNTCTVRENANNKVYGRLGYLSNYKKKNPDMMIALCGCMMQEPTVVETIRKKYKFVNLVFGTHNIYKFAELLCNAFESDSTIIDIWKDTDKIVEDLPVKRKFSFKSGVNIMFGCNNFCSYCIVPYVRGRERSREPKDIIREIENLVADGVVEIMLLGQNVNSYGKNLENPVTFAELLREINNIEGLKRIRFMTSHPKDLSDELIEAMKDCDKVCKHFHLPLQSGSSRILKIMNRHYDKEQYLEEVEKLRKAVPDIALTTDIIVGFPGETEEDFLETMDVVKRVRYDSAFTFIYSKRTGTPAATMDDQVPDDVVKDRFDRLLKEVQTISNEKAMMLEGKTMKVLAEEMDGQDDKLITGRLDNNAIVHFPGDASMIGNIYNVKLVECKGFYYMGEIADNE
ncbi:MAG: tRNA (N6-isopentenyl adenosine(37)-C2)-methylthiotransferase MiaB [Agathobacter sp.]|nr:tRNA (N6-isopentenyl adenosine(37)-C2)-methylthiotransferase MiaB [Agathobacter sp.]